MKKQLLGLVAAAAVGLCAARAEAKVAAVYASGQGGFQNSTESDPGVGFELGARLLILDGYMDYMNFGAGEAVSRGIFGVRGGFGTGEMRLVLRAGLGGIREERGALTGPLGAPSRTGGVARVGASVEGRVNPVLWLGFGIDGESYRFPDNTLGVPTQGSDILATLKLQFELGI